MFLNVFFYLEHEEDGVEDNEGHDEVLEGRRLDKSPQLILVTIAFLSGGERSSFSLVGGLVSSESCASVQAVIVIQYVVRERAR